VVVDDAVAQAGAAPDAVAPVVLEPADVVELHLLRDEVRLQRVADLRWADRREELPARRACAGVTELDARKRALALHLRRHPGENAAVDVVPQARQVAVPVVGAEGHDPAADGPPAAFGLHPAESDLR